MKHDVVVIGGGPAGSVCARELALLGYSVMLIERTKMPRNKVCGEYLNCGSVRLIEKIGLSLPVHAAALHLQGMSLTTAGHSLRLNFPKPALALRRSLLDTVLLHAARTCGVHVVEGRMTNLLTCDDMVCGVRYEDADGAQDVEARYVVGADGCGSLTARKLGVTMQMPRHVRYAFGGHFTAHTNDILEMHVDKGTYLAMNPLKGEHANVMLIAPKTAFAENAGKTDEWFRRSVKRLMPQAPFDVDGLTESRAAYGPLAHSVRSAATRNVLLIGDAAGFINPFTGQGVFIALSSARSAAATLHAAFTQTNSQRRAFQVYERSERQDRQTRSALSSFLDILAHAPFLAHRVMRRVEGDERLRERLLHLFCGLAKPDALRDTRLLLGMVG